MPVERIPGEKMYIDWVGDQPELLLDTTTGELRKVHILQLHLVLAALFMQRSFRMKNFHIYYRHSTCTVLLWGSS